MRITTSISINNLNGVILNGVACTCSGPPQSENEAKVKNTKRHYFLDVEMDGVFVVATPLEKVCC